MYGLRLINNNYVANGTGKVLASVRDEVQILSSFEAGETEGGQNILGFCLGFTQSWCHAWPHEDVTITYDPTFRGGRQGSESCNHRKHIPQQIYNK